MSLQSNLKSVKESFDSDEKILESAFTLERLWRRYRKYFIALFVCVVGVAVWWYVDDYIQSQRASRASAAYAKLILDADDKEALESLKDASPALYDMYRFFNVNNDMAAYEELAKSQNAFVRSLAQYEVASLKASEFAENIDSQSLAQSIAALDKIDTSGLKNLAILQEAYLLFNANKVKEAHQKLMLIPEDSLFWEEAKSLRHFGIKQGE